MIMDNLLVVEVKQNIYGPFMFAVDKYVANNILLYIIIVAIIACAYAIYLVAPKKPVCWKL